MIERAGEILRRPQNVVRATLAAGMLLASACGGSQASAVREVLKCPAAASEISRLAGGDPRAWEPINGTANQAWSFKSEKPQVLNPPMVGRVDTLEGGQINLGPKSTTDAFYVCVPSIDETGRRPTLSPIPTETPTAPEIQSKP